MTRIAVIMIIVMCMCVSGCGAADDAKDVSKELKKLETNKAQVIARAKEIKESADATVASIRLCMKKLETLIFEVTQEVNPQLKNLSEMVKQIEARQAELKKDLKVEKPLENSDEKAPQEAPDTGD